MPFRLANAPATFQSYINKALEGLINIICIVYLDNILIYSKDENKYIEYIKVVLRQLKEYSLYIKPSKCIFYTKRVKFLVFILTLEGVIIDLVQVQLIKDQPKPTSYKDI